MSRIGVDAIAVIDRHAGLLAVVGEDDRREGPGAARKEVALATERAKRSHRKARNALGEPAVRVHSGGVGGWDSWDSRETSAP